MVNDFYPRPEPLSTEQRRSATPSLEDYCAGIVKRGMEEPAVEGSCLRVDMTDPDAINIDDILCWIREKTGY